MSGPDPLLVAANLVGLGGIVRTARSSTSSPYYLKAVRYLEEPEVWPEYLQFVRADQVEEARAAMEQKVGDDLDIDVLGSDDIVEGEAALIRVTEVLVSAMQKGIWGSRIETRTCTRNVEAGELLQRGDLL